MFRWLLLGLLLVGTVGGAALAAVGVVHPATNRLDRAAPGHGLIDAYLAGDRPTVERIGLAAGARGLEPDLMSPHRATVLAAIAAAPAADDAWALLAPLARRTAEPDRSIAVRAAAAGVAISLEVDRDLLLLQDAPSDAVRDILAAWLRIALDPTRWADVRVHALEICARLADALGPDAPDLDWSSFAVDGDPEVRRAALELAPAPLDGDLRAEAVRRVLDDDDATIALIAAQVLCADLAFGANAGAILEALGDAGLARLRKLVATPRLSIPARFEAARCLAASPAAADRAAARKLLEKSPKYLRRAVETRPR